MRVVCLPKTVVLYSYTIIPYSRERRTDSLRPSWPNFFRCFGTPISGHHQVILDKAHMSHSITGYLREDVNHVSEQNRISLLLSFVFSSSRYLCDKKANQRPTIHRTLFAFIRVHSRFLRDFATLRLCVIFFNIPTPSTLTAVASPASSVFIRVHLWFLISGQTARLFAFIRVHQRFLSAFA